MRERLTLAAAVVLLAGSCGSAQEVPVETTTSLPTTTSVPTRDGNAAPGNAPADAPEDDPAPPTTAPAPPREDTDQNPAPTPSGASDDYGDLGTLALPYLRSGHPRLVVEITAVEGRAPAREVRDLLARRLRGVLDKPEGIVVLAPRIVPPQGDRHDLADIRAIEETHRRRFTTDRTAVMHYLFLGGRYEEDEGALGLAHRASSVAIFPDTIDEAATPLVPASAITGSVLVHEAGHLLRLVNIGYRSPRDHEDPDHPNHTVHRDGVMYWAVESISVTNILSGGPPDTFHPDSRADLEALKAGRITPRG